MLGSRQPSIVYYNVLYTNIYTVNEESVEDVLEDDNSSLLLLLGSTVCGYKVIIKVIIRYHTNRFINPVRRLDSFNFI